MHLVGAFWRAASCALLRMTVGRASKPTGWMTLAISGDGFERTEVSILAFLMLIK